MLPLFSRSHSARLLLVSALLFGAMASESVRAQWQPGIGRARNAGDIYTSLVLSNGDLVVPSPPAAFDAALQASVGRWDGVRWHPLASSGSLTFDSDISALARLPNGNILAGGFFTGGLFVWGGSFWTQFPMWPGTPVSAITVLANGDAIVSGFVQFGGGTSRYLTRWNGSSFVPFTTGSGLSQPATSIVELPNGDIVFGGLFTSANGAPMSYVTRWDGSSFHSMAGGMDDQVNALVRAPSGDLFAGGNFTTAGGTPAAHVARWDGASWSTLGSGCDGSVLGLGLDGNGDLLVGGVFSDAGGTTVSNVARWNGIAWSSLGTGAAGAVYTFSLRPGGEVVMGGIFSSAGAAALTRGLAQWDGSSWSTLTDLGFDSDLSSLLSLPNGELLAGGNFSLAPGLVPAARVARWNGTTWMPVGGGLPARCLALARFANGDIAAATANQVWRWNGASWTQLGGNFGSGSITGLAVDANGDLVAVGFWAPTPNVPTNAIARWNGSAWVAIGNGVGLAGGQARAYNVEVLANGDLVVGGTFSSVDGVPANCIARWNGVSWSSLGTGLTIFGSFLFARTTALEVAPNGDLFVAGAFDSAGGAPMGSLARWNGASWSAVPGLSGVLTQGPESLLALPNGDLIVGSGYPATKIARWNGSSATGLGSGLQGVANGAVALCRLANGQLACGGGFYEAGGAPSGSFAIWGLSNDECDGATSLSIGDNGTYANEGATASAPAFSCGGAPLPDLWHFWRAECAGNAVIETCGSTFDTVLEVFDGSCGSLVSLACNDDACGAQSRVTFLAQLGQTYYLRVGAQGGQTGSYQLRISITGDVGTFATRTTGCLGLGLLSAGAPTLGGTVTYALSGHVGMPALWFGAELTPVAVCPPEACALGADIAIFIGGASFVQIPVPCDLSIVGGALACQGSDFESLAGTCPAGSPFRWRFSDTVVTTIR